MNQIQAGQTLTARSIGDHDCIYTAEVLERKGNFVTVKTEHKVKRVKIHKDGASEFIFAHGRFSMCPVFRAPQTLNRA